MRNRILPRGVAIGFWIAVWALGTIPLQAQTTWADWTIFTASGKGDGSAKGSIGAVGVSYSGELIGAIVNGSSRVWAPDSSFLGGAVTTSPSVVKDDLRLNGRLKGTNTITFDSPVENPVMAIWSLGAGRRPASFTFDTAPILQAGGPNRAYRGSSITVAGNVVTGEEGNGVIQFPGTFTTLSWTNTYEHYYAFTIGVNGPLQPGNAPRPLERQ